jgi:hypothetical protein
MLENCVFYISRMYEFLQPGSFSPDRHARDARGMSASLRSMFGVAANRRVVPIASERTAAKRRRYSTTSSAAMSRVCGSARPSAFAVLTLITSSNLVGCRTGRSAGLSPLRIRPT